MIRIGKKGMEAWVLVSLLLLIIVAVLLIIFTGTFGEFIGVMQGKSSCQTWVDVQASRLGKPVLGWKAVEYESPCQTFVESVKVDTANALYRELADRQLNCFDSYRFGKENFYTEYKLGFSKTYCRACNEVYVDKESKVRYFNLEDYQIFLNTQKPKYKRKTYAEIFTDTENAKIDFGNRRNIEIDYGKPFYVMFTVDTEESLTDRLKRAGVTAGGFVVGRYTPGAKSFIGAFIPLRLLTVKVTAIVGGTFGIVAGATHEGFSPGVALMTSEDVVKSECDLGTFYINPVIKDKKLESKLASYRK